MKRIIFVCLLLVLCYGSHVNSSWAIDVGWMQEGVRVWYFGAVSTGFSSDAEEAYLFTSINGNTADLTHHSGLNHWVTPTTETEYGSIVDKGPCWIHPQVLQNIASGNTWQGQVISTVIKGTYTYDTFLNEVSPAGVIPYLLLPIKVLFDLNSQRNLVKIVYYDPDQTSTGIAYFDTDTGLLLLRENSTGGVTIFFILSEINYNFADRIAFAEDNGPHTGFQSTAYEYTSNINFVQILSSVETRYGSTVQMWVTSQAGGDDAQSYVRPNENYCFFGSEPVLKRKEMTVTPNYPPENWNTYGEYLWWWVPAEALAETTINIFNVSMARTLTSPYTFEATEEGSSLYFSKIIFDNDGYMTSFYAKDPNIDLDLSIGTLYPYNNIAGLTYYKNTMGRAIPDPDGDHDGMPDEWEVEYFSNTARDGTGDYDIDGLNDLAEYQNGSYPNDTDSDDDGLTDGDEVNTYGTDPALSDTDGDGMPDAWEVQYPGHLNPLVDDANDDPDEDGYTNMQEYQDGTDPTDAGSHPVKSMPWLPLLLE